MKVTSRRTVHDNQNATSSPVGLFAGSTSRIRTRRAAIGQAAGSSLKYLCINWISRGHRRCRASMRIPYTSVTDCTPAGISSVEAARTLRLLLGALESMVTIPHPARADTSARAEAVPVRPGLCTKRHKERRSARDRKPLESVSIAGSLHGTNQTERV
jgi:hypothetical protein